MILDLGCGRNKHPGAIGIDISADSDADYVLDLGFAKLPFDNNTVDGAYCIHAIEHIPFWVYMFEGVLYRPIIHFLREVHRVLKPGAEFYILTVPYPDPRCFEDPDHKSIWGIGTIRHFVGARGSDVGNENDKRLGLHIPFKLVSEGLTVDQLLEIRLRKPL